MSASFQQLILDQAELSDPKRITDKATMGDLLRTSSTYLLTSFAHITNSTDYKRHTTDLSNVLSDSMQNRQAL